MPANLDLLQIDLYAKFRVAKTRLEWKKDLGNCKYIPGTNSLTMINKFQLCCNTLQWPLPVQIEKFVRILPMQLRQFVVSHAHATFPDIADCIRTFQELLKVDAVTHVFKNVSFSDEKCILCNEVFELPIFTFNDRDNPPPLLYIVSKSLDHAHPIVSLGNGIVGGQIVQPPHTGRQINMIWISILGTLTCHLMIKTIVHMKGIGILATGVQAQTTTIEGILDRMVSPRLGTIVGIGIKHLTLTNFSPTITPKALEITRGIEMKTPTPHRALHVAIPTQINAHHNHTIQINKGHPIIEIQTDIIIEMRSQITTMNPNCPPYLAS